MALCGIGHRGPAADPNRGDGGQNARKQLGPDIVYLYHDRPGTVCAALCPHRRVSIIHSHRFQNAKVFPLHQPSNSLQNKAARRPLGGWRAVVCLCGKLRNFLCHRLLWSPAGGLQQSAQECTRQCTVAGSTYTAHKIGCSMVNRRLYACRWQARCRRPEGGTSVDPAYGTNSNAFLREARLGARAARR